jgi:nucleoside-diphosphate-sugar epimerase
MSSFAEKMNGRTVLVTGAGGFLGSHLVDRISCTDAKVYAVSRNAVEGRDRKVENIGADLSDFQTVRDLFLTIRPNVVFHLAGYGFGGPGIEHVIPSFKSDLSSAINVLVAATEFGVARLVLARSLEEPDDEPAPIPGAPYAAVKYAISTYAQMFYKLYGTPVVMARPFMTYGPRQKSHKIVPYVISSLLRGETPRIESGDRLVDWIYVDDVITGLVQSATVPRIEGRTFDLGSGTLVSIREMVDRLTRIVDNGLVPEFNAAQNRLVERVRVADTELTFANLGWKAVTDLQTGLAKTVVWYRTQGIQRCRPPLLNRI